MASMLRWPQEFCERLASHGRHVIRYDQRDSGLSTKYPPGRPGYGFDDAVDDAFRLLDGYRITAAHVAGFSQGRMVAPQISAMIKKSARLQVVPPAGAEPGEWFTVCRRRSARET
jgi:pimeloyl-ACP methyl ester carboxylesterase